MQGYTLLYSRLYMVGSLLTLGWILGSRLCTPGFMWYLSHHLIYPLTARVVGAPQIISQPVSSIFPCSPLPSGTWRTPGQAATDLVWYGCLFSSHDESWAKYNLMEPIPLQVEHMAVEFIVELFRPSGPFLLPMRIYAQWCRVDTSYFTHNWETRGGWEDLISSCTGPKDLSTGM